MLPPPTGTQKGKSQVLFFSAGGTHRRLTHPEWACGHWKSGEASQHSSEIKNETTQPWTMIARTAVNLAGLVDGFTWVEGTCDWKVDGVLDAKVRR